MAALRGLGVLTSIRRVGIRVYPLCVSEPCSERSRSQHFAVFGVSGVVHQSVPRARARRAEREAM